MIPNQPIYDEHLVIKFTTASKSRILQSIIPYISALPIPLLIKNYEAEPPNSLTIPSKSIILNKFN